jgi:hypothetical protein
MSGYLDGHCEHYIKVVDASFHVLKITFISQLGLHILMRC